MAMLAVLITTFSSMVEKETHACHDVHAAAAMLMF